MRTVNAARRPASSKALQARILELEELLGNAEQTLDAIRDGNFDAIVVNARGGEKPDHTWIATLDAPERPFGLMIEHIEEAAVTLNEAGHVLYCNGKLSALIDAAEDSLVGTPFLELLSAHERPGFASLLMSTTREATYRELTFLSARNLQIPCYVSLSVVSGDRAAKVLCCIITDTTQQKLSLAALNLANAQLDLETAERERVAAELERQNEWLRVTLSSIGDGVITTDIDGHVTWLNPVAERMTGWSAAQAAGETLPRVFHIVHESTREISESPVAGCLQQSGPVASAGTVILLSRNHREYGIEVSAAPIRTGNERRFGAILVFHDVTEQRRLARELMHRATHDALTGLVNRAEFDTRLDEVLVRTMLDSAESALLYIDLDQFKILNDNCGHAVGDRLLHQLACLLSELVRDGDTVARLGGDEFAILLNHCPLAQAEKLALRICHRVEDFRFVHGERRFRVRASVGLVVIDRTWKTTSAIMQAADQCCHAAKEAGRNRVHLWSEEDPAIRSRQDQMEWVARLEQALDEGRFVLFGQRILPLGKAPAGLHAEILIRIRERDGSLIEPRGFLPAAERFYLASRIDRWVLQRVIAMMRALPSLQRLSLICVNLSGQSLSDRAFHRWANGMLRDAGEEICRRLCLEITETSAVTNLPDAARFIALVRSLGIRVALDDFGAGASSFGYLKAMRVDLLKIDGQFIRTLMDDPLDEAAVRCFADVAKSVGMQTVAEFVESPEVLERLRCMGVDFAQGYIVHRPAPFEDIIDSDWVGVDAAAPTRAPLVRGDLGDAGPQ